MTTRTARAPHAKDEFDRLTHADAVGALDEMDLDLAFDAWMDARSDEDE